MNPIALERAAARLEKAERALAEFDTAISYKVAEAAWTDFLLAVSAVYNQLEQGAKGFPRSEAWFGRVKGKKRKDPVLRYLKYARNADEHGIEYVTARSPDGGFSLPYGQREEFVIQAIDPITHIPQGEPARGWSYGPHLKLVRAYDRRDKTYCDPPYATVQPAGDPSAVGHKGLGLIMEIYKEAQSLV